HQQKIRAREAGEKDRCLQVHLPAVALPAAGRPEILLDPPPELELERAVGTELEASSRGCGPDGRAIDAGEFLLLVGQVRNPRLPDSAEHDPDPMGLLVVSELDARWVAEGHPIHVHGRYPSAHSLRVLDDDVVPRGVVAERDGEPWPLVRDARV